jgi:hypothetical protein
VSSEPEAATEDSPAESAARAEATGTVTEAPSAADAPTDEATDTSAADAPTDGATDTPAAAVTEDKGDRWEAFGPEPERVPTQAAQIWARVVGVLRHEWTLAGAGSVALAAIMTWPTLRHPTRTIPEDIWDPTLQAWQMAWSGHALTHEPTNLWHSNSFFPERYSFAFSDTLLGYAPVGMIGSGPVAALLRYNIIFVLAFALAFFGAYALVRQLGASRIGAAVAGAAFAYAPWRLSQSGHLHVISSGGIALSLAMLARGHGWSLRDGYRTERVRPSWALAGWLVAAWQIMLGWGIGLPFAYVLGLVVLVVAVRWLIRRRRIPARLLAFDGIGAAVLVVVSGFMAYPYLRVLAFYPEARRSQAMLAFFSPPMRGFFTAPPESTIWGEAHAAARQTLPWAAEMTLLPGFALYGIAAAGLVVSVWTVRQRILLAAGVVVSIVLAMGTHGPFGGRVGYLLLYWTLPGFDGIRTSGRLVLWTTLLLGVLAAGAVSAFATQARNAVTERVPNRPGPLLQLATVLPLLLVLGEGLNHIPHPEVPEAPAALRTVQGPIFVLPPNDGDDQNVMFWTTDRFPKMVNGGSGFTPNRQAELRQLTQSFPDPESINRLRALGVKTVVVLRSRVQGTPYQNAADAADATVDDLGITRQDIGDAVVFSLG